MGLLSFVFVAVLVAFGPIFEGEKLVVTEEQIDFGEIEELSTLRIKSEKEKRIKTNKRINISKIVYIRKYGNK